MRNKVMISRRAVMVELDGGSRGLTVLKMRKEGTCV